MSFFDRLQAADLLSSAKLPDKSVNVLIVGLGKQYSNWIIYYTIRALGQAEYSADKKKEAERAMSSLRFDRHRPLWLRKAVAEELKRITGKPQQYLISKDNIGDVK